MRVRRRQLGEVAVVVRHAVTMRRRRPPAIRLEAMSAPAAYTRGCTRQSAPRPMRAEAPVGTVSSDGSEAPRRGRCWSDSGRCRRGASTRCSPPSSWSPPCSRPGSPIRSTRTATASRVALILVATVPYYLRRAGAPSGAGRVADGHRRPLHRRLRRRRPAVPGRGRHLHGGRLPPAARGGGGRRAS